MINIRQIYSMFALYLRKIRFAIIRSIIVLMIKIIFNYYGNWFFRLLLILLRLLLILLL